VIDQSGNIVTAAHVVDGASKITVELQGGEERTAELVGQDDATDAAVLATGSAVSSGVADRRA
jgi:S1-C subfamily serine protease